MNRAGFLTINSQPAVNAIRSDDPQFGWGGPGGRVYQKAYVEFFVSPEDIAIVIQIANKYPSLSLFAVDHANVSIGDSSESKSVTALTWGVFPNREILQPTVFDPETFLVWSEEAFQLWVQAWAPLYDDESESADLLYKVGISLYCTSRDNCCMGYFCVVCCVGHHAAHPLSHTFRFFQSNMFIRIVVEHSQIFETYYLVAIVDNDFIQSNLFGAFDEIVAMKAAKEAEAKEASRRSQSDEDDEEA